MTARVLQMRYGSCTVRVPLSHTEMQALQAASPTSLSLPSTSRHFESHQAVHRPAGLPWTRRHYRLHLPVHRPAGPSSSSSSSSSSSRAIMIQPSINSRLTHLLAHPGRPTGPHSSHISHGTRSSSSCGSIIIRPASIGGMHPVLLGAFRTVGCSSSSSGVRGLVSCPQLQQLDPQQHSSSHNVISSSSKLSMALLATLAKQAQMQHHQQLVISTTNSWLAPLLLLQPRSSRVRPDPLAWTGRGSARAL